LFYQQLMERFQQIVKNSDLEEEEVLITGRTLSAEEAIGNPMRRDFPIIKGKEKLMEAVFKGAKGQAFTDMPGDFRGQLQEVLAIKPENNFQRAVLISTMNAVLRYLGLIDRTVHCRNEDPELCSLELIQYIKQRFGHPRVALVGYQPAMLEKLQKHFEIRVLDLDTENINQIKYGVLVEGPEKMHEVLEWCEIILATGSTVVNATITDYCDLKPALFYGTTGAAAAKLMGLERWCHLGG
jgi:hypothetical protein